MKENGTERCLLVDYENIQAVNLAALPEDIRVTIFVGSSQNNLPFELVRNSQKLGQRLAWFKAEGNGNNALDFHIAYTLGRLMALTSQLEAFILSKDTGYDPLVRYLIKSGRKVHRIVSIHEIPAPVAPPVSAPQAAPKPASVSTPKPVPIVVDLQYTRTIELLGKVPKNTRPRKRTTLSQYINNMFQKKLSEHDLKRLVDKLFSKGQITESKKNLTYNF